MSDDLDLIMLERAIEVALEAEAEGNMPIGSVLTLDGQVVARGGNRMLVPSYLPGNHAEVVAMGRVDPALWPRAAQMTLYSTLEPCLMCMSTALLHGIGRVVYAARDPEGGAHYLLDHLPPYYQGRGVVIDCVGPLLEARCSPLYERARARFLELPCG